MESLNSLYSCKSPACFVVPVSCFFAHYEKSGCSKGTAGLKRCPGTSLLVNPPIRVTWGVMPCCLKALLENKIRRQFARDSVMWQVHGSDRFFCKAGTSGRPSFPAYKYYVLILYPWKCLSPSFCLTHLWIPLPLCKLVNVQNYERVQTPFS